MTPIRRTVPHRPQRPRDLGPVVVPVVIGLTKVSLGAFECYVVRIVPELEFERHGGTVYVGQRHATHSELQRPRRYCPESINSN